MNSENIKRSSKHLNHDEATKHNFPIPEIDIEPGRSIVGPAGYNLYKVGSMKEIPGLVSYVAVEPYENGQ